MIKLKYDEWLSGVLKKTAYKLRIEDSEGDIFIPHYADFIYAKVSTWNMDFIPKLQNAGFKFIDTNVILRRKKNYPVIHLTDRVRPAVDEDIYDILSIAVTSFSNSRFYTDSRFPTSVGNRIKSDWIENYFLGGRGDAMVVAENDEGRVVGFLLLIYEEKRILIDLIGVAEKYRGQRLGSCMIDFIDPGDKRIVAGTQISNHASLKFYESLGFKVLGYEYVFHYHKKKRLYYNVLSL